MKNIEVVKEKIDNIYEGDVVEMALKDYNEGYSGEVYVNLKTGDLEDCGTHNNFLYKYSGDDFGAYDLLTDEELKEYDYEMSLEDFIKSKGDTYENRLLEALTFYARENGDIRERLNTILENIQEAI